MEWNGKAFSWLVLFADAEDIPSRISSYMFLAIGSLEVTRMFVFTELVHLHLSGDDHDMYSTASRSVSDNTGADQALKQEFLREAESCNPRSLFLQMEVNSS